MILHIKENCSLRLIVSYTAMLCWPIYDLLIVALKAKTENLINSCTINRCTIKKCTKVRRSRIIVVER